MDIDASYFSKLIQDQKPEDLSEVRRDFFVEDEWKERYDWTIEFYRKHGELPKRETFEVEFDEKLPKTYEPISFYADELRKRGLNNAIKEGLKTKTIKALETESPDDALKSMKILAADLTQSFTPASNASAMNLQLTLSQRWEMYKQRKAMEGILGIGTPWASLNEATLGWCPGDLIYILAKSSVGKTWIALILADYAQKVCGKNVLFVSQEMPPKSVSIRADSVGARVSALRFLKGELMTEEYERFKSYFQTFKKKDNGWGAYHILGQRDVRSVLDLEIAIDTYAPELVIWDSFYLVADKKWDEQAKLVQGTKQLAEAKMVPIIGTGQFNRLVGGEDLKADQNAAAGSAAVIQDADVVLGLFQTTEMKGAHEMMMSSLKVRSGMALEDMTINWDLNTMEFHQKASMGPMGDDDTDEEEDFKMKFSSKNKG